MRLANYLGYLKHQSAIYFCKEFAEFQLSTLLGDVLSDEERNSIRRSQFRPP